MTQLKESARTPPLSGLWPALLERCRHASSVGALLPIETEQTTVEDAGIRFVVRRSSSLARKQAWRDETRRSGPARNPFLPYDPDLLVAELPPEHLALLNKYPVIPHHLLIVTRRFEDQENLLTARDFAALAACMLQIDGLAFYNGGAAAGASQPHKHLQLVPLPLAADGAGVPIDPLIASAPAGDRPGRVPGLPFLHCFVRLEPASLADPECAAELLVEHYHALCTAVGIEGRTQNGATLQSAPYNLLLTREWMLLVRRTRESSHGISVNALGFAGSLFVRDDLQMRVVLERGPMALLRAVALAAPIGNGPEG